MLHETLDSLLPCLPDGLACLPDWQAGGGGRFGTGGGGGFSGGGGDGDGVFWIFYVLIRLAIEVPLVGVPLLIVAVVIFVKGSQKGWFKHQERVIRTRRPRVERQDSRWHAELLEASDPAFDEARFLTRTRAAFERAQESWCAQELEPLRAFVTDGVFERFSMQIEEQLEDGWRQGMADLRVGSLAIIHLQGGRHFETLTVRIPFQADIHRVDLETGERISGSRISRTQFSECWSFVRRRGAKTRAEDGLIEGQCPNCGAPLRMNQAAQCGSCQAFVRSGQYDWVLSEITQASEWRPEREKELPGFARYAESDPGISVQLLEDRASVAFWRKVAADRRGDVEPLARVADEEFCARYAESLRAPEGRERVYLAENAVGSVRTLGILPGEEHDRALVEVVWDACRARVGPDGRRRVESSRLMQRALLVFQRRAGARTKLEESFSTTFCRNCGAHDLGGTDPRCPYCEAPRTGPSWSWLLHEVVPDRTGPANELRRALAQEGRTRPAPSALEPRAGVHTSAADLLAWAAGMARADGDLEPRERAALQALARRMNVSEARIEAMLGDDVAAGAAPAPRDTLEARSWLKALVEVALADGSLQRGERRFLKHAAQHLGVRRGELERIVREARDGLYRAARSAPRA